ncbi:MAG: DMT family transporter [Cyclobacteriaceae bacterium]|nr:DMT family transporter [Cyclobacteriaceae bacterium]
MPKQIPLIAWGVLILLSLIWGSSFILIKRGLEVFSPGEVGALRILAAGVVLMPFSIFKLKNLSVKKWKLLFFVGMVGSFIPAFLFATAQTQIDSSVAGILNALTPLFVMLIGAVFFNQHITRRIAFGLAIGFLGTVFLIMAGSGINLLQLNYYAFFIVVATVCYGANVNLIKFKIHDINAISITAISLLIVTPIAAIYLFGATPFISKLQQVDGAYASFGYIVLLGVMGTALALVLFNHLVKITTPIFTSSVTYLIPIIAVIWGLLDGEVLLTGHFIGLTAIIVGVFLANRRR